VTPGLARLVGKSSLHFVSFLSTYRPPWKKPTDSDLVSSRIFAETGAKESEVAHTSTLTSNIHSLFISFYRPTQTRWKIVIEKGAFPSDWVSRRRKLMSLYTCALPY
jgi:kynureninase